MKEPPTNISVWTRGRFLMIVAALFALQIGLIALFGAPRCAHQQHASGSDSVSRYSLDDESGGIDAHVFCQ